jgi:hypothetical protein
MDTGQHRDRRNKPLYDAAERTDSGAAFYNLYSRNGLYRVEILVLEDGKVCEAVRYRVNDDLHPYPAALAGDHRHSFAHAGLETRAKALAAVLKATDPRQRTTLPCEQPQRVADRIWQRRSGEVSNRRKW